MLEDTDTQPNRLAGVRKPFRAFCTDQYYTNRDEYFAYGQTQPHTMQEYIEANIQDLKARYRRIRDHDTAERKRT